MENNEEFVLYLKDCNNLAKPIYVDFAEYNKGSAELIKACGISKKNKISVLDCTAGLCKDSFILANTNCDVVAIEKNNVVFALLQDGFERGLKNGNIKKTLDNITLINGDSIEFLKITNKVFDCIYLDPMFDKSKKSRLVKKEMQFFHNLIDKNEDKQELFYLALEMVKNRVVVKRPLHSEFLINNIKPSFQIKGKTIRYDVYVK